MDIYSIISKKKYKKELNRNEIEYFIEGYIDNSIPDYQASALLMAILLNGLTYNETACLTETMINSGDKIDLSGIDGIKVDKHSSGGVGDKISLISCPLAAAAGVKVAKMSGRALGHTGGTIDKLESIKGFNTALCMSDFISSVNKTGICIASQTKNIVPADKKLYALRDVTATIDSIPLIAASIMSKKIASGADKIVLDIKCGNGAFMKTAEEAEELAQIMVRTGNSLGKKTMGLITDMNIPLGKCIGNRLEVIEAIDILSNKGDERLKNLAVKIAAKMLEVTGQFDSDKSERIIKEKLISKEGLSKLLEMIENQGGDIKEIQNFDMDNYIPYKAKKDGYISSINTENAGLAARSLGAGRIKKDDIIDYNCGLYIEKTAGDYVEKGEQIIRIYKGNKDINKAVKLLDESFSYSDKEVKKNPVIYKIIN
jgi:pyrimidine-nucleoside phosphorylase